MAIQPAPPSAAALDPAYRLAHTLSAHTRAVTALRFTSDGRRLVSAGADGWLHIWDAEAGEHIRSIRAHRTGINDISLSPDALYVATASDDGTSVVYPLVAGLEDEGALRRLAAHTAPALAVAFSPKSNLVVTGSFDESVIVWDVKRGAALHTIQAHADAVWTVGWDAEGALVITGSADGLMYVPERSSSSRLFAEVDSSRLWDATTGQCLRTLDNEYNAPVAHASFTPSSFFILSSVLASSILVYNLHNSKVLKTLRAPEYTSEKLPSPALVFHAPSPPHGGDDATDVSANGHRLEPRRALVVAGSENGKVVMWDLNSRRVVAVLDAHSAAVIAIAVGPDGQLATGGLDQKIKLWIP